MDISNVDRNGKEEDRLGHFARDCRLKGKGKGRDGGKAQGKGKCKAGTAGGGQEGAGQAAAMEEIWDLPAAQANGAVRNAAGVSGATHSGRRHRVVGSGRRG